jgi:hypothetical protein
VSAEEEGEEEEEFYILPIKMSGNPEVSSI